MNQPIVVRRPSFDYAGIPRHWLGGSAVATALANGINLLFPHGERFFVRSVKRYLDRVDDAHQRDDVRAFFAQEGRHAAEHERFFRILEAQGYEIESFLDFYERWSRRIERFFSPELRLATTAACEHFTATLAHAALADGLIDGADERVKALLFWHALEEIEHKAVAFDVLTNVAASRRVRIGGFLIASACLGGFWLIATRHLLRQDGVGVWRTLAELSRLRAEGRRAHRSIAGRLRAYLGRDFHPWNDDDRALAERAAGELSLSGAG